jgi:hypothetical protein
MRLQVSALFPWASLAGLAGLTIQARARELKAQGRSADDTAATVQKELQAIHPAWARANGAAGAARAAYAEAP